MANRLSVEQLHKLFINDLGPAYVVTSDIKRKPLLFSMQKNEALKYKAYIYNCTNPPGARTLDEYKIQLILPGQKHGSCGTLDESDGTTILLVGYAIYDTEENGAWIMWETSRHTTFRYSANLQVKMGTILDTITQKVFSRKKRKNGEIVVASDREHLQEALALRQSIDLEKLLEA